MSKLNATELAKEYDWDTENQYFDYIIESKVNGQNGQVRSLYNAMEESSKQRFINYLKEFYTVYSNDILSLLLV